MDGKDGFVWLDLFGKEIQTLLMLYPKDLKHEELAEKLGITDGYLSRKLKPLIEQGIVHVDRGESSGGRPPNIIKLTYKTRQVLDQVLKASTMEKKRLPDVDSFNNLLDLLMDENEAEYVADLIQSTSRKYCLPENDYYFQFLAEHLPDSIPENKIRVILDSTKNFVSDMSEREKTQVYESLGSSLREVLETSYSKERERGIHKAAKELLDQLDLQNLSYEELEKRYLESIEDKRGHPEFYREIILAEHKDHLLGLWLKVHDLSKSDDPAVSSRASQEKSLLKL